MADEEGFSGGVDELWGEGVEVVDGLNAFDLGDQAIEESEVAGGDAGDGGQGGGVGDRVVVGVVLCREARGEDSGELVGSEGPVLVGEADAAVELGVAGEAFLDAGHANEDDAHVVAVVLVADLLEARALEPVGFVDDQELGAPGGA